MELKEKKHINIEKIITAKITVVTNLNPGTDRGSGHPHLTQFEA